jgi:hypothetical protein
MGQGVAYLIHFYQEVAPMGQGVAYIIHFYYQEVAPMGQGVTYTIHFYPEISPMGQGSSFILCFIISLFFQRRNYILYTKLAPLWQFAFLLRICLFRD